MFRFTVVITVKGIIMSACIEMTADSYWNQGQRVKGFYCGKGFSGVINENTRPTPDGKNVIFGVTLDSPIEIFGQIRERIEISPRFYGFHADKSHGIYQY
jgi:hypothetical protein